MGPDLAEIIDRSAESSRVYRYETPTGDFVYVGGYPANQAGKYAWMPMAESVASIHSGG
jgi:hypothetical protein